MKTELLLYIFYLSESQPCPFDPPEHLFRVRLVCVVLDTCGQYFDRGSSKKRLDCFLVYFQVRIQYQASTIVTAYFSSKQLLLFGFAQQYSPWTLLTAVFVLSQQTQNIFIAFVQCRPNVFDIGPTLYKCYTNVLCLLGWYSSLAWSWKCQRNFQLRYN